MKRNRIMKLFEDVRLWYFLYVCLCVLLSLLGGVLVLLFIAYIESKI